LWKILLLGPLVYWGDYLRCDMPSKALHRHSRLPARSLNHCVLASATVWATIVFTGELRGF